MWKSILRKPLFFILISTFSLLAHAAEESGELIVVVKSRDTSRPIRNAEVTVVSRDGQSFKGQTDDMGRAEFSQLAPGLYEVAARHDAHIKVIHPDTRVTANKIVSADLWMPAAEPVLEEVVVMAQAVVSDQSGSVSSIYRDREQLRTEVGGGSDVLRALDGLPGLASNGEFASFSVRGRGPRDNLILIDNMPYNQVVHFDSSLGETEDIGGGGRFSIFSPNLISGAEYSPGGWSAAYSGKSGSLLKLDVAAGDASPVSSLRLDMAGIEVGYEGPSGFHDGTSIQFNARRLDFGSFFETIDELDIGDPVITDVIFKSVTDVDTENTVELLFLYTPEEYERTVDNVFESPNFEDVDVITSEQNSALFGVTWKRLVGETGTWHSNIYYRTTDSEASEGEAYPDLAPPGAPASDFPVRKNILTQTTDEAELGFRSDYTVENSLGTFAAGISGSRIDYEFTADLNDDWVRYSFGQDDFRPDPSQYYIVLTPEEVNAEFNEKVTTYGVYAEQLFPVGDWEFRPGIRYDHDDLSSQNVVSPRLAINWRQSPQMRYSLTSGIFYQAPRLLDRASDPLNSDLKNERIAHVGLGFERLLSDNWNILGEAYYQKLDDLIVGDSNTDAALNNEGEGTSYGVDFVLTRYFTNGWSGTATYSYNESERDDNDGLGKYDADFHRKHIATLGAQWEINERWKLGFRYKYMSGTPIDEYIVHENVQAPGEPVRFSQEFTEVNADRNKAFNSLNVRVDYQRTFGTLDVIAFMDIVNLLGQSLGMDPEFNPINGELLSDDEETTPLLGLKLVQYW